MMLQLANHLDGESTGIGALLVRRRVDSRQPLENQQSCESSIRHRERCAEETGCSRCSDQEKKPNCR
jgi:hypothetical protein